MRIYLFFFFSVFLLSSLGSQELALGRGVYCHGTDLMRCYGYARTWYCYNMSTDLTPERRIYIPPYLCTQILTRHRLSMIHSTLYLVGTYCDSMSCHHLRPWQGLVSKVMFQSFVPKLCSKALFQSSVLKLRSKAMTLPRAGFLPQFYNNANSVKSLHIKSSPFKPPSRYPPLRIPVSNKPIYHTASVLSFISWLQVLPPAGYVLCVLMSMEYQSPSPSPSQSPSPFLAMLLLHVLSF